MDSDDKVKLEIDLIARSYIIHKRRIRESENNGIKRSYEDIHASRCIVEHIEDVVASLNEKDKFIIENEIVEQKEGKWYMICLSTSTYYRQRKRAYKTFLRNLDK